MPTIYDYYNSLYYDLKTGKITNKCGKNGVSLSSIKFITNNINQIAYLLKYLISEFDENFGLFSPITTYQKAFEKEYKYIIFKISIDTGKLTLMSTANFRNDAELNGHIQMAKTFGDKVVKLEGE